MKNYLFKRSLILLLILAAGAIESCKKDDDRDKDSSDKVILVTIEHTGDLQYYMSYLSVNGTINKNQKRVAVGGVSWDEQTSEGEITVYEKSFEPISGTITFQTETPASAINFGYSAYYIPANHITHTPVVATIKYYVDGSLVKTDTYSAAVGAVNGDPYLGHLDLKHF